MVTEKRLIDANAEIATIKENVCKNCNSYDGVRCRDCWIDDVISFLEDAPTVDAVEVVHGRWQQGDNLKPKCSICGKYELYSWADHSRCNYCPNCGAIMDGAENGK